jgi:hypothetical protein
MMKTIPMFPLSILPLPGELVPLHIFEPRYKQLLEDAETDDISFGIFFNNVINNDKIGSLMKLESIIKRFPAGEADIIVKCYDIFTMDTMTRTFKDKLYPGGDVTLWNVTIEEPGGVKLTEIFQEFLEKKSSKRSFDVCSIHSIAQELNLDYSERYSFLVSAEIDREKFLIRKIKYLMELLKQEEKSKNVFHLN